MHYSEKLYKLLFTWSLQFKVCLWIIIIFLKQWSETQFCLQVSKGSLRELGEHCLKFVSTSSWHVLWILEVIVNPGELSIPPVCSPPKVVRKVVFVHLDWPGQAPCTLLMHIFSLFVFATFFLCGWSSKDANKIQRRIEKLYLYL